MTKSESAAGADLRVATIRDVAALAGVSRATASYAFSQPSRVSEESRGRVLAAASELGYVGNDAARRLRKGRSAAFGLLVSNTSNPNFAELAAGAENEASRHGRFILTVNSDDRVEREREYISFFESQQVAAIIAAPVGDVPRELLELRDRGTPFALVGTATGPVDYPAISGDNRRGGQLAGSHLIAQGRRHVMFVGGSHPNVDMRLAGVTDAADAAGVTLDVRRVEAQNAHIGARVAAEIAALPLDARPDAIAAGNDLLALGLLHGLINAGIRVPEDISLIGYDDIEFADFAFVPLSSIRHPSAALGAGAVRLLLGLESADDMEGRFAPELVVRGTSLTR